MGEEIITKHIQQDSIKLIKGQRGTYGWEIKIHAKSSVQNDVIRKLKGYDGELRKQFPNPVEKEVKKDAKS